MPFTVTSCVPEARMASIIAEALLNLPVPRIRRDEKVYEPKRSESMELDKNLLREPIAALVPKAFGIKILMYYAYTPVFPLRPPCTRLAHDAF